jgi:hypothetical protein
MKPSRRAALARIGAVLVLLAPLAVSSDSPDLPPENRFSVFGTLTRSGGGPLENHTVALLAKGLCQDTTWALYPAAIALTRPDGRFSLSQGGWYWELPCSLVVAVVWPDSMMLGTPFAAEGQYVTEWDTRTNDGFLCDDTFDVEVAHDYFFDGVTVEIP